MENKASSSANTMTVRTLPPGTGLCSMSRLQRCASMRMFTLNLATLYLVQIAFITYVIGSYRTLEKRFNLSSQQVGALNAINDAIQVVSVVFIGYFARRAHKPRVMSISILFFVIGAILYAMPYFIFGSKEGMALGISKHHGMNSSLDHELCVEKTESQCYEDTTVSHSNHVAYCLIALAQVSIGIGGSCIRIMGFTYLDENVTVKDAPMYIGMAGVVIPIGPILGFLLAAVCTSIPENLHDSALDSGEPGYIGAWWLGFLIIAILVLLSAMPMYYFPKHFAEYYTQKLNCAVTVEREQRPVGRRQLVVREINGFLGSLWRLSTNVTLITFTLSTVCHIWVMMGMAGNLTRYLEIQFHLPAFKANIITAVAMAVPGMLGSVLSGIVMKKKEVRVQGAALMHVATCAYVTVTLAIFMALGCPQESMAGTMVDNGRRLDVAMVCNAECQCSLDFMRPVCTASGMNYLSSCHAGCQTMANQTYFECGCDDGPAQTAVSGLCWEDCKLLAPFIFFMVLASFVTSIGHVPETVINLRIVEPELRSFSLGIVSFASNLVGFIPAPIVFGILADSACLVWQESCGQSGACLFYSKALLRLTLYGACFGFQFLGLVFATVTWALIRRDTGHGKYSDVDKETEHETQTLKGIRNQCFEDDSCEPRLPAHDESDDIMPNAKEAVKALIQDVTDRTCQLLAVTGGSGAAFPLQTLGDVEEGTSAGSKSVNRSEPVRSNQDSCAVILTTAAYAIDIMKTTHQYAADLIKATTKFAVDSLSLTNGSMRNNESDTDNNSETIEDATWVCTPTERLVPLQPTDRCMVGVVNLKTTDKPEAGNRVVGDVIISQTNTDAASVEVRHLLDSAQRPVSVQLCHQDADIIISNREGITDITIKSDIFYSDTDDDSSINDCREMCESSPWSTPQKDVSMMEDSKDDVGLYDPWQEEESLNKNVQSVRKPALKETPQSQLKEANKKRVSFANPFLENEDFLYGSFFWDMITLEDTISEESVA